MGLSTLIHCGFEENQVKCILLVGMGSIPTWDIHVVIFV
jgi:hypothetical protein